MSAEENVALVRRLIEEYDRGNTAIVDEVLAPGFAGRPGRAQPQPGQSGHPGYAQRRTMLQTAFRARARIAAIGAEGDVVKVRTTWRGTHEQPFRGLPPTGLPVEWTAFETYRVEAGKVAEYWLATDLDTISRQLAGAAPRPSQVRPEGTARETGNCEQTSVGCVALPDLGTGTYHGFQGGLYPDGANRPPAAYAAEGRRHAAQIVPLDGSGRPDPNGTIALLSIGMSNTTMEFSVFKRLAGGDTRKSPRVVVVDGAQGGQDAEAIKAPHAAYWDVVSQRLDQQGVAAAQVQAVWLKQAIAGENRPFPEDARHLQAGLQAIVDILARRYPNLRIVYLSSRIYAGYATTPLNPEPHAYQGGFAVKWLIEEEIAARDRNGERAATGAGSNATSTTTLPWLAWGPYLWTDGLQGRSDGFIWNCADSAADGTHPAPSGAQKVAQQLLHFFANDETARPWFVDPAMQPTLENVPYGPHERNVIDFWKAPPAGSVQRTPLLLFIHGGGFRGGDKRAIDPVLLRQCLDAGISVAAINYRLSQHAIYPAPMLDSARALQFIRSKAEEWGIDPQRVAASGGSAGGGISLWLGFHDDLADPQSADPVARQSTRLTCMAVRNTQSSYDPRFIKRLIAGEAYRSPALPQLFGVAGPEEILAPTPEQARLFEEASPINYVAPDAPPVYLTYSQPNVPPAPDLAAGPGIHHPRFGAALKEKLDHLGVECIVRCKGDPETGPNEMDFLRKHLRPGT